MTAAARPYADDAARWQAVSERDAAADGHFLYAVITTGVYCRPHCASRRGHRDNVVFFDTGEAAERAGYRPCRRCRPDLPPLAERHAAAVADACRTIETAEEMPSLAALADAAGISRYHFHRIFRQITGVTPKQYATAHQHRRVRAELDGGASVTEAIFGAGYSASSRFYEGAAGAIGMTPTQYRRGGDGTEIRFAVGQCSLGAILVAATDRGVCAIQLGDDPDALVRELQERFPNADLRGGDGDFEDLVARVVGFVEAPRQAFPLPLDITGTAFQQRVWQALTRIPTGRTATYADIAREIGNPRSVRAVAQACAANPAAVAIPCHRVVRSDGSLSGYRWGVARKAVLLDREGAR